MLKHFAVGAFFLVALANGAHAVQTQEMTDPERALLPTWCNYCGDFDKTPNAPGHYNSYLARYGEGWKSVHHYCWALVSLMRYHSADPRFRNKEHWAHAAIYDMDYVLRNVPDDFVLRREILHRKARLLLNERRNEEAQKVAGKIVQSWPDRADSHGVLAEALVAMNKRNDAKRALDEASSRVKDDATLAAIRSALKL